MLIDQSCPSNKRGREDIKGLRLLSIMYMSAF